MATIRPPQERLARHDAIARKIEDRLEHQVEFAPLERVLHLGGEVAAAFDLFVHQRLVHAHLAATAILGAVQGQVGVLQQRIRIGAVGRRDRYAERCTDVEHATVMRHGLLDQREDLLADRDRVLPPLDRRHHGELVSAKPRDDTLLAKRMVQAAGDPGEQRVAGEMPERVVDLLEAIEIDPMDRQSILVVMQRLHPRFELFSKCGAIGHPRQIVAAGDGGVMIGQCGLFPRHHRCLQDDPVGLQRDIHHRHHEQQDHDPENDLERRGREEQPEGERHRGEQQLRQRDPRATGIATGDPRRVADRRRHRQQLQHPVVGAHQRQQAQRAEQRRIPESPAAIEYLTPRCRPSNRNVLRRGMRTDRIDDTRAGDDRDRDGADHDRPIATRQRNDNGDRVARQRADHQRPGRRVKRLHQRFPHGRGDRLVGQAQLSQSRD